MSIGTESPSSSSMKFIPNQPRLKFTRARLLFSAGVRLIYGKEHPINRHTWRKMKANGELTEEQLQKEEVLLAFHKELFERQHHGEYPRTLKSVEPLSTKS
uniref:Uncharacterized protein n=1 Tax=Ditylenchus dipsaci TaxID=166011 RepID=A0A915DEE8_9BILA